MINLNAQSAAQTAINSLIANGDELGLQVAAYLNGELVVDACAGHQFMSAQVRPLVTPDTLFVTFSVSKGITATLLHLLAERGQLDYDAPVAHYWPEFAANDKATITVRQALAHQAGLPHLPADLTGAQLLDWGFMTRWLAAEAPLWQPGSATGYHALTFGWLIGEIIQRVDGRPLAEMLQAEVCGPLGIDRLFFGVPDALLAEISGIESPPPPQNDANLPPPNPIAMRTVPMSFQQVAGTPAALKSCLPASGAVANARSLAKLYAALVGDGVDGVRLLSPECFNIATQIVTDDIDLVLGSKVRKALGYFGGWRGAAGSGYETAFGHPGAGGFTATADPSINFSFALCKSRMVNVTDQAKSAARIVEKAVRDALQIGE